MHEGYSYIFEIEVFSLPKTRVMHISPIASIRIRSNRLAKPASRAVPLTRSRCNPIHGLAVDIFECLKKDAA